MVIKEFKFIRDLKKLKNKDIGLYFDTFGEKPKFVNEKIDKSIRPFIIFYSNGYYYYLICRSAKNHLGQTKTKFDSEVLIYGSKNSNVVPEYDSYIRTNQIFKISAIDLNKIVDFDSPKFTSTKSLLESNDVYHQLVVKRIKERLLTYLSKIPPQVALTEIRLENNEIKAKPLYANRILLEIDKKKNTRSEIAFNEILHELNAKNKKIVITLFNKLLHSWRNDDLDIIKNQKSSKNKLKI